MKTIIYSLLIAISFLLSSCPDNSYTKTEYTRSFFLGDESFVFEGEIFSASTPPVPLVSVTAKLFTDSDIYDEWKITGTKISENRFQFNINTTANGITLEKQTIITNGYYKPLRFPDSFPAIELVFYFNEETGWNKPYYREPVNLSKNEYNSYMCYYVYVAEPIDLSGTVKSDFNDTFGRHCFLTSHYDLNLSKPGWYKFLNDYHSEIGNDPKFSSTKNNYLLW
ncbi:MAG: hypothetical protein LBC52_01460 [Treponema sp.]|jgi:hypothetical protein|nr:hypothetical protein [Treponema sp.]